MRRFAVLVLMPALLGGAPLSAVTDSVAAVRDDFERVAADGLSAGELQTLAERTLVLARQATRNRDLYSAMTLLSTLVSEGPPEMASAFRAAALELLTSRFRDSRRWAIFVEERFHPDPERIPADRWDAEVAAFDALLDNLRSRTEDRRIASELVYAQALLRVRLHQSGRWLEEPERHATLALLLEISRAYGELPRPGAAETTLAQEIEGHLTDLRTLYQGSAAPVTRSVDLGGDPIALADYRGQVVILDFWTTFCLPCLALVPGSLQLLEKYKGRPLVLLGVNGDSTREEGLATAERTGMTWRSFWDGPEGPSGPIATAWRVHGWPMVYVIDAGGRVRYRFNGKESVEEGLEDAVRTLLDEIL